MQRGGEERNKNLLFVLKRFDSFQIHCVFLFIYHVCLHCFLFSSFFSSICIFATPCCPCWSSSLWYLLPLLLIASSFIIIVAFVPHPCPITCCPPCYSLSPYCSLSYHYTRYQHCLCLSHHCLVIHLTSPFFCGDVISPHLQCVSWL